MFGHQREELLDLVNLGFASDRLEVEPFTEVRMAVEAVASTLSVEDESEVLDQFNEVGEADVSPVPCDEPFEQLPTSHVFRVPAMPSRRLRASFLSIRTAQTLYSGIRDSGS